MIKYCRPPWTVTWWPNEFPVPADWLELTFADRLGLPPALETYLEPKPGAAPGEVVSVGPGICAVIHKAQADAASLGVTAFQLVRGGLLGPRIPLQGRTARRPRPPRARRPARPPRPPRPPRPRKLPRNRRTRAAARRAGQPRDPKTPYCVYFAIQGDEVDTIQHDLFTASEIASRRLARGYVADIALDLNLGCPSLDKSKCEKQAETFVRPLQDFLGWRRPEPPQGPRELPRLRFRGPRIYRPPTPTAEAPTPVLPPERGLPEVPGRLVCVKDGSSGPVDSYAQGTSAKGWPNGHHGPWAGTLAPPEAPGGAGLGA